MALESYLHSAVEEAILKARNPVDFHESEDLTVLGHTGKWINKDEVASWKGEIPIAQYIINEDANPEVIRKKTEQQLIYEQEVAIRYLRPPTPPPPGEILIKQDPNIPTPPAPPLVIRQQPPRPETPPPLIVREAPPRPPAPIGPKVITISGKRLAPPPRKVVIERLAPLPSKPQAIMVERWLPYAERKRRVIFQKNEVPDPVVQKPKNVVIQWEAPQVQIKRTFKDLGVIRANPVEYVERYGASLKTHREFPEIVHELRPPVGVVLAAEYNAPSLIDLEGDINALNMIDLDKEGLPEYKDWLKRYLEASKPKPAAPLSIAAVLDALLTELFHGFDANSDSEISIDEAEAHVLKIMGRLGRDYSKEDADSFFQVLDKSHNGSVNFAEFKAGLLGLFNAH